MRRRYTGSAGDYLCTFDRDRGDTVPAWFPRTVDVRRTDAGEWFGAVWTPDGTVWAGPADTRDAAVTATLETLRQRLA